MTRIRLLILILFSLAMTDCKQVYEPAAIHVTTNFLVVEGVLNSGPDSTYFTLSRTKSITDTTFTIIPETHATIFIEDDAGNSRTMQSLGNGKYGIEPLKMDQARSYRLTILTGSSVYHSDYVAVKQTPPIDSISWAQPDNLTFYVNTHDPTNSTRYYRWEYDEAWQYQTPYESFYKFQNGMILDRDSSELVHDCYRFATSNDIILATSAQLNEDIITQVPLVTIPQNSRKVSVKYSLHIKQYALTEDAFKYWQLLKKNTQQLGTLFDAQPSQLTGNLHCENNPTEPVIGFVSASSVQEARMFVNTFNLRNWQITPEVICSVMILGSFQEAANYIIGHPEFEPAYAVTGGGMAISTHKCVDCRLLGGTNQKPAFWP